MSLLIDRANIQKVCGSCVGARKSKLLEIEQLKTDSKLILYSALRRLLSV